MNIKKILTALSIMVILVTVLGCVDNTQTEPSKVTKIADTEKIDTVKNDVKKVAVPEPTKDSSELVISYSTKKTSKVGEYTSSAKPGKTFLIVTMTIENNGYKDEILTNPNYFYVLIDNIKYKYDSSSYSLTDALDSSAEIMNGGKLTGSLAFEIPDDAATYQLKYDRDFKTYNIRYVAN